MTHLFLTNRMKKRKVGKKIQNWHRPLGPSQLRQRFLWIRYDDPEFTNQGRYRDYPVPVDDCWNCYDPHVDSPGCDDERFSYNLSHLWSEIANPHPPHTKLELPTDDPAGRSSENTIVPVAQGQSTNTAVEERLAAYVARLARLSSNDSIAIRSHITDAIGDADNLDMINSEYAHKRDTPRRICIFAPFWQRSPQAWDKASGTPLLDHLFVLYDIPRFLYAEWFRDLSGWYPHQLGQDMRFKWLCWFILLGQGGSLKRAAELFNWRIPSKLQHHLTDAPSDASPTEACLIAEVKRLGGSEIEFVRLLQNPAFVLDPTEFSAGTSHRRFWQDTVRWLIAHRNAITDEESDLILSWAMHEYTETEHPRIQPFTWKGRRVRAVLERSIQYNREVERPWSDYQWQAHGWDWVWDNERQGRWSFVELTSGAALFREGQAMRHCVASYAARCVSGHSAIVSVKHNDIRRVTLEINPRTRRVVQARGVCNRSAEPEERRAISLWMNTAVQPDRSP